MQTFVFILEIIGTIAFAASGAMTALKKDMDLFGIAILGITTAVGGGALRDIILGNTPPSMFEKPIYTVVAAVTSLVVFFPFIRRTFDKNQYLYDHIIRVMDALGLAIFTVMGINVAKTVTDGHNLFLLVFVGVITGVGGGLMRDVMAGDTPYIFVKHVYASASIAGALVCALLWEPLGAVLAMFIGATLVFTIRLLAAHYKWSLPHAK
ncbi:MAG: trimeric intracellular cation channel family protein [Ruminococcaceae bacterium]|nr:trimeric intracellular cation channel family protein [Oscillospiraceae bacterium]